MNTSILKDNSTTKVPVPVRYMNVVPVKITVNGETKTTWAMNDPCASSNFMTDELRQVLRISFKLNRRTLELNTATSRRMIMSSQNIKATVSGIEEEDYFDLDFEVLPLHGGVGLPV